MAIFWLMMAIPGQTLNSFNKRHFVINTDIVY